MTIPVMKPWFGPEEAEAAAEAVRSGWVAQGPRVAAFEQAFAETSQARHGVAVSSCTAGLHLALALLGVGPGDEVVVPSLSFIATTNVVRMVGATPVFADVDEHTQNLTVKTIAEVAGPRTAAVIVVDQAGIPADLPPITAWSAERGIAVIEDAACAAGSIAHGRPVGSGADLAAFSFHPRKVLTTGEGGMVLTDNAEYAERLRRLREHGMDLSAADRHASTTVRLEQYVEPGFNYRMTDVQAAIGLVQLGRLAAMVERRRELARRYREALSVIDGLDMAADPPYGSSNFQSFWIRLPDEFPVERDQLLQRLLDQGISARRGIMAAHLEPACADLARGELAVTERLTARSLILPLFHELTAADQAQIIAAVLTAAGIHA